MDEYGTSSEHSHHYMSYTLRLPRRDSKRNRGGYVRINGPLVPLGFKMT